MTKCPFSVIESRWWDSGNHSVRSLFEAVASIHYDNPSAFYYDMFADKSSLGSVLNSRGIDGQSEVIYLASHGDESGVAPGSGSKISRAELRNILTYANSQKQIRGLFLGTCLTGNAKVANFLFKGAGTNLDWVAGYSNSVDWIDGSAIDMIFFSKLAELYRINKGKKKGKLTAIAMAHTAATSMVKLVQGAHSTYGFNIYFCQNNKVTSMFK